MTNYRPDIRPNGVVEGEVELRGSIARSVAGEKIEIERSAVRSATAEEMEIEQSAVAFARAGRIEVEGGAIGVLAARSVEAGQLRAMLVLSPSVRGTVHTLFDLRTALAVGAGFFIARRAFRLAGAIGGAIAGRGRARRGDEPSSVAGGDRWLKRN